MRAAARLGSLTLLMLGLAGCTARVFSGPVHLSTKEAAVGEVEKLGRVSTKQCGTAVIIVPILDPWSPLEVYDALLEKADALGADAVVDYQVRGSDLAGFWPLFVRGCVEHAATAVRFR